MEWGMLLHPHPHPQCPDGHFFLVSLFVLLWVGCVSPTFMILRECSS